MSRYKNINSIEDHLLMVLWVVGYITLGGPFDLVIISFQPVLHNWCNTGCDTYYPACGIIFMIYTCVGILHIYKIINRVVLIGINTNVLRTSLNKNISFIQEGRKDIFLFNYALNTCYFTVIWCRTYGKGPLR